MDWLGFIKNLWIDPRKHPDFAWVWITRALVVMGLWMVQEAHTILPRGHDAHQPGNGFRGSARAILVISLGCATVTACSAARSLTASAASAWSTSPTATIGLACLAFVVVPSMNWVYAVGVLFGLGYGAYYSVDWALGCDVLPNKDDAAKDMAVWNIAMVLPQSIALPLSGAILGAFGHHFTLNEAGEKVTHYSAHGYTAMFGLAAFFLLLAPSSSATSAASR